MKGVGIDSCSTPDPSQFPLLWQPNQFRRTQPEWFVLKDPQILFTEGTEADTEGDGAYKMRKVLTLMIWRER